MRRDDPASLTVEQANLAATLQFTIGKGNDIHLGAELTVALVRHWLRIARNKAGLAWIDLLMLYADDFSQELRADVLAAYAHLDVMRTKAGLDAALEAIAMYRDLGDEDKLAAPLFDAASAYAAHGDLARADDLSEESLAIARRNGDKRRIADTLMGMGLAEHYRSNWYRATTLLEESLELYREIGDDRSAALQLGNLGDLAASAGDLDRAVSLARQSLAIFERLRLPHWIAWQLVNLGTFELSRGEKDAARPALQRGLEIVHDLQEPWFTAGALDSLARLAVADGKPACALRLTGYADALIESLGVPRQPSDESEYRRVLRESIRSARRRIGARTNGARAGDAVDRSSQRSDEGLTTGICIAVVVARLQQANRCNRRRLTTIAPGMRLAANSRRTSSGLIHTRCNALPDEYGRLIGLIASLHANTTKPRRWKRFDPVPS